MKFPVLWSGLGLAVCVFSVDWLVSYALCDWTILAKVLTRLSGNAKNTFLQVFPSIEHVYIIKRQIYYELEIRCLQLQLSTSESSLVLRLFSSASSFSVCSKSDRRFFSFATQFLQTYLFSVDRKDISKLSISETTSNCFHRFESNTVSFIFSMTRQHKLQYTDESDIAFSTFSNAKQGLALNKKTKYT